MLGIGEAVDSQVQDAELVQWFVFECGLSGSRTEQNHRIPSDKFANIVEFLSRLG